MAVSTEIIRRLLNEGSLVFGQLPTLGTEESVAVADLLEQAHAQFRREIAGPSLPFNAAAALAATRLLCRAGWLLLAHDEPAEVVEKDVQLTCPGSAAQHVSADLLLRFLPGIHRRARAVQVDDVLTRCLAQILRQWPLSGVLADLDEGPLTPCDFQGHPGLMLLYAERLADHVKPAWVPQDGPAREWVERVFAERGLPMPALVEIDQPRDRYGT